MSLPDFFFVPAGTGPTERRERLAGMGGEGGKGESGLSSQVSVFFQPGSVARDESLRSILTHDKSCSAPVQSPNILMDFPSSGELKGIWLGRLRTGLFAAKQTFFRPCQIWPNKKRLICQEPCCCQIRLFFAAAQVSRSNVIFP